jgi:DNA polymerase-3 subunit epsilon
MKKVNFTAFDFETATYDRMPCQLGMVIVREGKIVEEYETLIKPPENKYDSNCTKIHGISRKDTENCLEFDKLWPKIQQYFEYGLMVAHNVDFDADVLNRSINYYKLKKVRVMCYYDTMSIYRTGIENVANAFGFEFGNHHNALTDARMCAKIYLEYLRGFDISKLKYPEINNSGFWRKTKKLKAEDLDYIEINENPEIFIADKKAVISGEFHRFPIREDLKHLLEYYSVKFLSGISKNVNLFIVGDDYGHKKMEAVENLNKLGHDIKILQEKQLYELLDELNKWQKKNL